MNWDLRCAIDAFIDLFDNNADHVNRILNEQNIDAANMVDVVNNDLAQFAMYLSCSDGEIKLSEAIVLEEQCGISLTPEEIRNYVERQSIFSREFEEKVPLSVFLAVELDKYCWEQGKPLNKPICQIAIDIFSSLADEVIAADFDIDESELADANNYLAMLNQYIDDNAMERKKPSSSQKKIAVKVRTKKQSIKAPEKS